MSSSLVKTWFGEEFNSLHPLLRDLHTHGGILEGKIHISTGTGVGKYIGKAIAKKRRIQLLSTEQEFEVVVSHENNVLNWARRFGKSAVVLSAGLKFLKNIYGGPKINTPLRATGREKVISG